MRDWLAHRACSTPTSPALVEPSGRPVGGDATGAAASRPAGADTAPVGDDADTTDDRASGADGDVPATTYRALDERVEEVAGRLSALGVGVDDHLAVCLPSGPTFVELVHATMRVGAVLVPLSTRLTAAELGDRLDRVDPVAVVCGRSTADRATTAATAAGDLPVASPDASGTAATTPLPDVDPETYDLPAWTLECPLVVVFTSGTTGEPKATVLTVGNVAASAACSAFHLGVRPDDRWFDPLPMYHMGGLAPVYRSTLYGTTLLTDGDGDGGGGDGGDGGFDPGATLAAMAAGDPTCVSLVPTMLSRLLDAGELPDSLRFVLLGGAPTPPELVERCAARGVPVAPTYGMTETASQIATARPAEAPDNPDSVGHPLVFTDLTVVDESGAECDHGEVGELVVSGPTVTPGYYDQPDATEAAFGPHGFHTGDAGYRDRDGRVFVTGRVDERITTGGETVDPEEVAAVVRSHPAVSDVAVVGRPDEEYGERVAALVVADGDLSRDALEAHCRERLAGFKLPRTVAFANELPRTASGTVDRAAVRDLLE